MSTNQDLAAFLDSESAGLRAAWIPPGYGNNPPLDLGLFGVAEPAPAPFPWGTPGISVGSSLLTTGAILNAGHCTDGQ